MVDPHVCARCGAEGSTCCKLQPGQEQHCFPMSAEERERMAPYVDGDSAFTLELNTEAFAQGLRCAFPHDKASIDALFPVDGTACHYRLATHPDGACTLLGPEGCILPREARPYYCRLFPFWVCGRKVMIFTSSCCLAQRETKAFARLAEALGMTDAEIRRLHDRLRRAWGLDPQSAEAAQR